MDDQTIVASLGSHQSLEEDDNLLDLTGPQATSTVAGKMTREQLHQQYLQSLQEASEGSSEEFQCLRSSHRDSTHHPHLSREDNRGSSGMGVMMALPLIDTEGMSGLSSSNFLMDHTRLPVENEISGEPAGLPSALLEPRKLPLDQNQQDTMDLTALTSHLARTELEHDSFFSNPVQYDTSHISVWSTFHEGSHKGLEVSKLLSSSCNSLGCIDGPSDSFLTHQQSVRPRDVDWLKTHQRELADQMEDEEFQSAEVMFFEEEEKKHHEKNRFCIDMAPPSSRNSLDISCFSGIHGVTEITVRPSWIGSPEKELLGSNNRMLVDDYLQARSEALGTLGDDKDPANRPNFGKEVHSPPTATRVQSLAGMSVGDESSTFDASESSMKPDSSASSTAFVSDPSKGSKENTLVSEERQASTTNILPTDQNKEQTIVKDMVHEVEELEASSHALKQPIEGSTINSLLTRALATDSANDLLGRILQLCQESPVPDSSLDNTGLDVSLDVMELRQMRENIMKQKGRPSKTSHQPGKENSCKGEKSKAVCNSNRKPLQCVNPLGQCPPLPSSPKHMKLMAVRTSSDPGIPSMTYQEKDESNLEETLQGARYMSKFVDDTASLILPSFNQGGAIVKSSTPCIPRSHIPVPDILSREPVASTTNQQRAPPRMGLRSSTKGLGKMTELGVSASGADEVNLRTLSSWPANMSAHPTTITTNAYARPHHHKENASHSHTNYIGVSVPPHVILPEACVVGMASYTTLPLHNPSSRWLQISLVLLKETVSGSASMASALLFQPSHFLEPHGRYDVRLGVCCPVQGQLEALLELQIGELTTSGARATTPSTHTVTLTATITMPKVEVQCEGELDCVDFGVVGESCCLSHTVTLTSHCPHPLPLLLHLHQMVGKAAIFCWEENQKTGKVVSASHLSCELPPSTPTTFSITLRAPLLEGITVPENGRIQVGSFLNVLLDTPAPTPLTLASHPIKAAIGVVQLQILRTPEPLVVDANPHESGTTHLTLKNGSTFPLHISLSVKDDFQTFSVHPSSLTMPPGTLSSPALTFTPGSHGGTVNSKLVLRVEPDGMEFKIGVCGVCHGQPEAQSSVSVSGSTPSSNIAAHTASPSLEHGTASVPISGSVSAPPVCPAHKQVQKVHAALTKANSASLSEVTSSSFPQGEKNLSSLLQSTKSRLVFGTVAVGATSSLKLVLRNNLTTEKLPLRVTIIGSSAFQVCESGDADGQDKLDVVLEPCEELPLSVLLRPSSVEPLSATLICHHRSSSNPFKWKIPLQGYGGRGELVVKGSSAVSPLIFKDLALGLPSILQTSVSNTGHRTLFLVLQMFSDKQCKEAASDLSVRPTRVVVGAGETHEVYILANSTQKLLARTPGLIGVLQVISGEQILRRRYQRMKNKTVKARHIKNPDLLKVGWMEEFTGEQNAQQEPDILPPQPEDAVVFFNGCTITQVKVFGEPQPNDDHSRTAFADLAGEQTVADLTTTQIERVDICNPTPSENIPNQPCPSSAASWDMLPQTMSVQCGDTSPQVFFIVNFTSTRHMLEVSSNCNWLEFEPCEAVLLGHSCVKLCVTAYPPPTITLPVTHSLKVMGENESRSATITILPTTKEVLVAQVKPSKSMAISVADPLPIAAKQSQRNSHHTMANTHEPVTSTNHLTTNTNTTSSRMSAPGKSSESLSNQQSSAAATTTTAHCHIKGATAGNTQPPVPSNKRDGQKKPQRSLVQLVSDDVSFPDTKVTRENHVKVMLRNLDNMVHSVQAKVTQGPFIVRHTQFTIKSGHYVSVPVCFRPRKPGLCTGFLQLTVLKDKMELTVRLSGQALP